MSIQKDDEKVVIVIQWLDIFPSHYTPDGSCNNEEQEEENVLLTNIVCSEFMHFVQIKSTHSSCINMLSFIDIAQDAEKTKKKIQIIILIFIRMWNFPFWCTSCTERSAFNITLFRECHSFAMKLIGRHYGTISLDNKLLKIDFHLSLYSYEHVHTSTNSILLTSLVSSSMRQQLFHAFAVIFDEIF